MKKLMLLLLGIFLISFVSATITVILEPETPTNTNAELKSGGNLEINTTYYYVVFTYESKYYSPYAQVTYRYARHSPLSEEKNFTTNDTHRTVNITWDNSVGATSATRYQIFLTTNSNNYTNSGGYGTSREEVGSIDDGGEGYEIDTLSSETWVVHSAQLVNNFTGNIDKNLGIVSAIFNESDTHYLDDVYDAIVAAGYEDYVFYDGYNFIFKGWFIAPSPSDVSNNGKLVVLNKRLTFLKGGISVTNTQYTMTFGQWDGANAQANYRYGSSIDIQNSRYPLAGTSGNLQFYGAFVSLGMSRITTEIENLVNQYYTGGLQIYYTSDVSEFKDSLMETNLGQASQFRAYTSDLNDLKAIVGNNYGNGNHIRLRLPSPGSANMPYTPGGKFYATDFMSLQTLQNYEFNNGDFDYTDFYDCDFTVYPDGILKAPYMKYSNLRSTYNWQSNNTFYFHYSIIGKVLDEDGNPLENVTVNATDKDGNPVEWIEHDGTLDRIITGTNYTTARLTDENGSVDYYLQAYQLKLNQSHDDKVTDPDTSTNTINTYFYPFTITFSKDGYRSYTVKINELTEAANLLVTLESRNWNYSNIPEWKILNETGHTILKLFEGDLAISGELYENTNSPPSGASILWNLNSLMWLDDLGNLYLNKLYELIT